MATTIIRSASQSGWPLRNIHISNENGSFTFYVDVFGPLSLPILLPDLTVYMITRWMSYKKQELHAFRPRFFDGVRSFLCCLIMRLYVLSSVLWRPLWFPHKNDVRFVFTPLDCSRDHGLFVFVAYSVVQHVLTIWVTWRVPYMKQELLTLREHLSSPPVVWWSPCCSPF
jgi:hypothetical protein